MFTDNEANSLLLAGKLLEQMADKSTSNEFNSAMYKIKSVLNSTSKENLEFLNNSIKVYNFRNKKHNSYLSKIQNAILQQKKLVLDYFSYYSKRTQFVKLTQLVYITIVMLGI